MKGSFEINLKTSELKAEQVFEFTLNWSAVNKKFDLRIGWIAEGQGETNIMCHASEYFKPESDTGSKTFSIVMPIGPLTRIGELFSVNWQLEVEYQGDVKIVPLVLKNRGI